jgi:competence protein ComEC
VGAAPVAPAAPAGAWMLAPVALGVALMRPAARSRAAVAGWLALVVLTACACGLALGGERLRAIDAGAVTAADTRPATVRGFAIAVPRRSRGSVSVRVETADGRLLVRAPEPVPEIAVGREIEARGTLSEPADWERGYLRTHGVAAVLDARRIELTGARRGGIPALTDRVRDRAETALERGMPDAEAALARGFVLGQDDRIDAATVDDFKRSGLAHLLAVSGQNVVLLGLLAIPLLAVLGIGLRARLVCILVLIAVYVPVTGAGPSIQRAGVMGAAAIVAGLAGTPRSRWYALALAALATLAVNPRASADVGWQLSFAAVAGILLWAATIRDALLPPPAHGASSPRRALAEGAALTIAATLATAPLMAHHFESLSVAALPANLLALPAVAPVMWLGMLAAMAGQVAAIPVEPLNAVNALLIGYIAWVAHALGSPGWAQVGVHLSASGAVAAYAALLACGRLAAPASARRAGLRLRPRRALAAAFILFVLIAATSAGDRPSSSPERRADLEVSVLDVGQGDAILFEPAGRDAVLVDGGPPGAGLPELLRAEGVERLGLVVLTHDSLDHAAGVRDALDAMPVEAFAYATAAPLTLAAARSAGARLVRVAAGRALRVGALRLEVLWPPRELAEPSRPARGPSAEPDAPAADPGELNTRAVVLLARSRGFEMLLTSDAESESVPIHPGPVDVLKVAHHGSDDAGLGGLLDRSMPRLAVIPVGEDNAYGHPTPATLAELAAHEVPVARTDTHGSIQIEVDGGRWAVLPEAVE